MTRWRDAAIVAVFVMQAITLTLVGHAYYTAHRAASAMRDAFGGFAKPSTVKTEPAIASTSQAGEPPAVQKSSTAMDSGQQAAAAALTATEAPSTIATETREPSSPAQYVPPAAVPSAQTYATPRPTPRISVDAWAHSKCAAQWTNEAMRAHCESQEMSAKASLTARTYTSTGMWPKDFDDMRRECQMKWPQDYSMQDWCEAQRAGVARKIGQTTGHP